MPYYTHNVQYHDNCKLCANKCPPPPLVNMGGTFNMPRFAFAPARCNYKPTMSMNMTRQSDTTSEPVRPTPEQILKLLEEYIVQHDDKIDMVYIRQQLSVAGYNDMRGLLKIIHPDKNKGYPQLSQIVITIIRTTH